MKHNTKRMNDDRWIVEQWQQPAGEAGGDFVVCGRDSRFLRIFVGDVSGHGDAAASAADMVRPWIARELRDGACEATLRRWSELVYRLLGNRFVAFTYLEIDMVFMDVLVVGAGNPAVIIRREGGRVHERLEIPGMPLGIVGADEWCVPSARLQHLSSGDEIVCFTDGLPDTRCNPDRHRFGMDGVMSALVAAGDDAPVDSLRATVLPFVDWTLDQDDITVLSVRDARRQAA